MENESLNAFVGKSFKVTLESMLGSTNYGWCLESLPAGIVLTGQDNRAKTQRFIGPVDQVFYFLVMDEAESANVELSFGLYCMATGKKEKTILIAINIIAEENDSSAPFLKYSENEVVYAESGEMTANLMQDYPSDRAASMNNKYGYPCAFERHRNSHFNDSYGSNIKYGYPCAVLEYRDSGPVNYPNMKYGYHCAVLEYRDFDPVNYPNIKYGYPGCQ